MDWTITEDKRWSKPYQNRERPTKCWTQTNMTDSTDSEILYQLDMSFTNRQVNCLLGITLVSTMLDETKYTDGL